MCTAVSYKTGSHYFGRNLDLEYSFQERVTITPRNFVFHFRNGQTLQNHYALIGMATIVSNYPLYYEATNDAGLSLAGLNFPGNAVYYPKAENLNNITPFELIPWILGKCADTEEALRELKNINLWDKSFSNEFPLSPLHWMLSDKNRSFTIETTADGLRIYENKVGILTNNPPFEYHLHHLAQYMGLSSHDPINRFSDKLDLKPFSLGMGAMGLPGDPSSPSRFVKAAFVKWNSIHENSESASVGQFFHILSSVAQQKGITHVRDEQYEFTLYSSCCNTDQGIYYYTTYDHPSITAVDMHREDLNGNALITYPLRTGWHVDFEN